MCADTPLDFALAAEPLRSVASLGGQGLRPDQFFELYDLGCAALDLVVPALCRTLALCWPIAVLDPEQVSLWTTALSWPFAAVLGPEQASCASPCAGDWNYSLDYVISCEHHW